MASQTEIERLVTDQSDTVRARYKQKQERDRLRAEWSGLLGRAAALIVASPARDASVAIVRTSDGTMPVQYTDGLVERPGRAVSILRLRRASGLTLPVHGSADNGNLGIEVDAADRVEVEDVFRFDQVPGERSLPDARLGKVATFAHTLGSEGHPQRELTGKDVDHALTAVTGLTTAIEQLEAAARDPQLNHDLAKALGPRAE